jgi:hypothetical protein
MSLNKSRKRRRSRRVLLAVIATGVTYVGVVVQAPVASASTTYTTPTADLGILPFALDVWRIGSNGSLIPVDPSVAPLSTPLFNLGGSPLNLTWGQFSSATAKSYAWTVTRDGTTYTQLLIRMSGLVPDGVYSLFYTTFDPNSSNALCPNVETGVPLTAAFPQYQKPDPDSFLATSSGKGWFFASVPGDLLAAQGFQVRVIYHLDGMTYGPVANAGESQGPVNGGLCRSSYGIDAIRQFLIIQK